LGGYEWKMGENNVLAIDLKGIWAGGKRYIPFDEAASRLENEAVYNIQDAYKNRFDDYYKLDFRISFKMNRAKFNQEWAIDLQNITNTKNVFTYTWVPGDNNSDGYVKTEYQSGFYPMMLWRIQF